MVKSEIPASNFLNVVASTSPDDFNINFNKATNTLFANLTVKSDILGGGDGATSAYHIGFGDPATPANKSAYIDDVHYAAIETPGATSVLRNNGQPYAHADSTAYLASGEQLGVTNFFPETFTTVNPDGTRPFCDNCDFLQWGAWGARFGFGTDSTSYYADNVHLGWWVAGDVITDEVEGDLPFTGSAYYSGNAIGNVANNLSNQGWTTYVATGNMNMSWDFGERSGRFDITNFDKPNTAGLNFGGDLSMPGVPTGGLNKFSGALSGTNENLSYLRGSVTGSFVRPLSEGMPSGALGNWNIGNNNYKASGIFAGGLVPAPAIGN